MWPLLLLGAGALYLMTRKDDEAETPPPQVVNDELQKAIKVDPKSGLQFLDVEMKMSNGKTVFENLKPVLEQYKVTEHGTAPNGSHRFAMSFIGRKLTEAEMMELAGLMMPVQKEFAGQKVLMLSKVSDIRAAYNGKPSATTEIWFGPLSTFSMAKPGSDFVISDV